MRVESDRRYPFPHPATEVWDAIARVDAYRSWWPWLRRFDADGLAAGDRWTCTVRPPLPYVLRLEIDIVEAERPWRISASVGGDVAGDAAVELREDGDGCEVRLRSSLGPTSRSLRAVAGVAPWLARFGHDWVLDTGARQFRRRALAQDR